MVTGETTVKGPQKKGPFTPAKIFTRSQAAKLAIKDTIKGGTPPKKFDKMKGKSHGLANGKKKVEPTTFIDKETISFQSPSLQESKDETMEEQKGQGDFSVPQFYQGNHEGELTPQRKKYRQALEETIKDLTISKQNLRRENATLKENKLRMQKEYDEWHEKVTCIMKNKQAQIDHKKNKNEMYRGQIQVESSRAQLDYLAAVAAAQVNN